MRTLSTKHLLILAGVVLVTFSQASNLFAQKNAPGLASQKAPAGDSVSPQLTCEQVVAELVTHNQERAGALRGYTGRRVYTLDYRGFPGSRSAELVVEARYSAPGTKSFTIVSQTGSKLLLDRVLKRLLTTEEEAQTAANRQKTALTPQNYRFELVDETTTDQGNFYVLKVEPRSTNKLLYRGKVWVDAKDFAVARIDAEPAVNPSFWISHTSIEEQYAKFGLFWLPVRNESVTKVRFGGTATLVIQYEDYNLEND